jgi:diacylglycerol kinase (ATP)
MIEGKQFHFNSILCGQNSMRITLVHNPKAGHGTHKKKDLMNALAKFGHRVIYRSTEGSNYQEVLERSTDLVIAAGGDGTIEKIASRLIDSRVPLSVLPLGAANNLARSLGFAASTKEIIARLQDGKERAFDVGLARGPWGKRFFLKAQAAVCSRIICELPKAQVVKLNSAPKNRKWRGTFP